MQCKRCGYTNTCGEKGCGMFCERCGEQLIEYIDMDEEFKKLLGE